MLTQTANSKEENMQAQANHANTTAQIQKEQGNKITDLATAKVQSNSNPLTRKIVPIILLIAGILMYVSMLIVDHKERKYNS